MLLKYKIHFLFSFSPIAAFGEGTHLFFPPDLKYYHKKINKKIFEGKSFKTLNEKKKIVNENFQDGL